MGKSGELQSRGSMLSSKYWRSFYSSEKPPERPSDFAKFCLPFLKGKSLVDIGCGNGRDANFFAEQELEVTGIDPNSNPLFDSFDFVQASLDNFPTLNKDILYSRFLLHCLTPKEENKLIEIAGNFKQFCVEARSDSENHPFLYSEHYRRPINLYLLKEKLKSKGWEITYSGESKGWASYKKEDPMVLRIIASHN